MRRVLILALVLTGTLLLAPQAGAYIYWSSYNSGNSTVGRADLDGLNANQSLVDGIYFGGGVATDGAHVYWGESGGNPASPGPGAIGRANTDGTSPDHHFLSSGTPCGVFALEATSTSDLWWQGSSCSSGNSFITHHSGAGYVPVGSSANYSCGFDVDASHIYYSERRYIVRANLDGSGVDPTWLDLGAGNEACAVTVDVGHVYWTYSLPRDANLQSHGIGRADIDGDESSIDPAFLGGIFFGGTGAGSADIAVAGDFIYWINQQSGAAVPYTAIGSIGRANLNGTGVDQDFIGGVLFPTGLDVDSAGPPPAPPCTTCNPIPTPQLFPVFSNSGSTNSRFSAGQASTPVRGRAVADEARRGKTPVGTTFFYGLDQTADVTIEMKRKKAGRMAKGKCVKPSKKSRKGKKCDLTVAKLFRGAVAGHNEVPFTGRVKGKAFAPGKYLAVFTATGASGKSSTATVPFKIVPPQ